MKIAVLGSGDCAHALAFEWSAAKHEVYMYDLPQNESFILDIASSGGIYSTGIVEGFQPIKYAGNDLREVLHEANLIFVASLAENVDIFGKACSPYVEKDQVYVVVPSSSMGALAFKNALGLDSNDNRVTVAEMHTAPYMSRQIGPAKITVFHKLNEGYKVAALPKEKNQFVYEMLSPVLTGIEKADSVLQTTLQDCGPATHPVIATLNAALIERTCGDFFFYNEGVTPAVASIMKAIDEERIEIGKALGIQIENSIELGIRQGFFEDLEYVNAYSNSSQFDRIISPSTLDFRFYTNDIGYTMIFWIELAEKMGVPVPVMTAISTFASCILQRDLRKESPLTFEKLGLKEYTQEELKSL